MATVRTYSWLARPACEAGVSRDELVKEYFHAAYSYNEIIVILGLHHGLKLGLRQLKRILRGLGLRRRGDDTRDAEIVQAMQNEIHGAGSSLGYRSMARRLLTRYGLTVSRTMVSDIQRMLDPDGVSCRQHHRLRKRIYINKGPNFLVHVDGYDKLKPYGFAIHGAICGYSRRILWLNACSTNNDPEVIAFHFMNYVKEIEGVPRCIRVDAGTENVLLEDIQKSFRWDHADDMAAEKSFLIGSSKSNQRIERWWLNNKQGGCQFWIDEFKDLVNHGILSTADPLSIDCARFCFMDVLQNDLDTVRMEWNQHPVRHSRNAESPGGKPDIMYFLPELYDVVNYKIDVSIDDVEEVQRRWCKQPTGCSVEVANYLRRQMEERGLQMPTTFEEALSLFAMLLPTLE